MEQTNNSDQLLASLDANFGFPNSTHSSFKKVKQTYDNEKNQHVIWIAYTVKVNPGQQADRMKFVPGPMFKALMGSWSPSRCSETTERFPTMPTIKLFWVQDNRELTSGEYREILVDSRSGDTQRGSSRGKWHRPIHYPERWRLKLWSSWYAEIHRLGISNGNQIFDSSREIPKKKVVAKGGIEPPTHGFSEIRLIPQLNLQSSCGFCDGFNISSSQQFTRRYESWGWSNIN